MRTKLRLLLGPTMALFAIAGSCLVHAQTSTPKAGEVEFARGVGFAQQPGQGVRTLGRGLPLAEGDRLTTAEGATAIVRLEDGTRMTLRPNSEIVLEQWRYGTGAANANSLVLQLLRGGLRAITGLVSKGAPDAARIRTATATVGIRGTDFDARVCLRDCADESGKLASLANRPNAPQASAKVVRAEGGLTAVTSAGERRALVAGGSVYPGEMVETAAPGQAVLAFRDESRVSLGAGTRFRVDNFVFDRANPGDGRFLVSLLKGTVRALTGLVGKANPRNVGFATATATVGIRGTGFDLACSGVCAGEADASADAGLSVFTWQGSVSVVAAGQSTTQTVEIGQGLLVTANGARALAAPSAIDAPRPDGVTVPPGLFSQSETGEGAEGLYVFVRDGHLEVATASGIGHFGRGEAGFSDAASGAVLRPLIIPRFLDFDPTPMPNSRNPLLTSVMNENGVRGAEQCR